MRRTTDIRTSLPLLAGALTLSVALAQHAAWGQAQCVFRAAHVCCPALRQLLLRNPLDEIVPGVLIEEAAHGSTGEMQSIALDASQNKLYWSPDDGIAGSLRRVNVDGTGGEPLGIRAREFAVDAVGGKVYFI